MSEFPNITLRPYFEGGDVSRGGARRKLLADLDFERRGESLSPRENCLGFCDFS
jgi:hypothetical protein